MVLPAHPAVKSGQLEEIHSNEKSHILYHKPNVNILSKPFCSINYRHIFVIWICHSMYIYLNYIFLYLKIDKCIGSLPHWSESEQSGNPRLPQPVQLGWQTRKWLVLSMFCNSSTSSCVRSTTLRLAGCMVNNMIQRRSAHFNLHLMRASVTDLVRTIRNLWGDWNTWYKLTLTVDAWPVCLKRYKDVGRLYIVLLGKFDNNRIGEQRRVIGAERRIAGNNNVLATAELDKLLLRARTNDHLSSSYIIINTSSLTDEVQFG